MPYACTRKSGPEESVDPPLTEKPQLTVCLSPRTSCIRMPYAALIGPREIHPRNSHLRRAPKRETAGQAPAPLHEERARPAVV